MAAHLAGALTFRADLCRADIDRVRNVTEATGFFSASEVEVAVELIEATFDQGATSGYSFLFAERGGTICGYTCFGPVPCTAASFDLYWIVVDAACQGQGIGKRLLVRTEQLIREAGGRQLYAETSSRRQYRPTRAFYRHAGFLQAARLRDFYAPGDSKIIYCKVLNRAST
ncbi:MAG: GNAT family N-acetyltransferase [Gammaproteobacteria bacterium]